MTPALIVLGLSGHDLARTLRETLPGAEIHAPAEKSIAGADIAFADLGPHLRDLFRAGRPILGFCAAGILIRVLAPELADKRHEPPVVAIAEDGSAVVPLLGGHHGGNDLARRIAEILGIAAAITTAGDLRFGLALDRPPTGYRLRNPEDVKPFVAALLAGARVRLVGDAPWLREAALPIDENGALTIHVTTRALPGDGTTLIYHPQALALGIGCERGIAAAEIETLLDDTLTATGLARQALAGIFSLDLKADEPAIQRLAETLGVPARFFPAATLKAETPRLHHPSEIVDNAVGTPGVAEAAALAAAGPTAHLIVPKRKSRRATLAIAEAPTPIAAATIGQAQGALFVVGLGPGQAAWRTPEAAGLIATASDIVGYGGYLDLLGDEIAAKRQHRFALGEEELRVAHALRLAAEGRVVALLTSGDPGIYAMASLVFELVEKAQVPGADKIAIRVAPGISALQAAAARAGAPLGHDFCAISLSDLLTPWDDIRRRIEAAAAADFVIAFYNPASEKRRRQLAEARAILARHRPAATPVVLARNLGRPSETVEITSLGEMREEKIDMLTLVLVGATTSRVIRRDGAPSLVYTPRGYDVAGKAGAKT